LQIRVEIVKAAPLVRLLREELGLPATGSFVKSVSENTLRDSIAGVFDPQMLQNIAYKLDKSVSETEHLLKNLSGYCGLLPDDIRSASGQRIAETGPESQPAKERFGEIH